MTILYRALPNAVLLVPENLTSTHVIIDPKQGVGVLLDEAQYNTYIQVINHMETKT
jgi:hypothetical protein